MQLAFSSRPNAWRYMALALCPSPGLHAGVPDIQARWDGWRASARDVADFTALCGLPPAGEAMPSLLPHATAFRLQMAMLTHPSFPVPIWRVLQVRNRLRQVAPAMPQAALDFGSRIAAHRVLEKGAEFDLHTRITSGGELVAESLNSFYVRGRFAAPAPLAPPAESPAPGDTALAQWEMPPGGGLRFGRLTGDYNGIHLWDPYARMFGFRKAFFHPLRVVAQALAHSAAQPPLPWQLDVWLKGPVLHGSRVELRKREEAAGTVLSLAVRHDPRPAIVMRLAPGASRPL